MSFSLFVRIPKDSKNEEIHFGTPIIIDGLKWHLVAKLVTGNTLFPVGIETYVEITKVNKHFIFGPEASLTYQTARVPSQAYVEQFDTSKQRKSKIRWFSTNEVGQIGDHSYMVTASVKLSYIEPKRASYQAEQQSGATSADRNIPTASHGLGLQPESTTSGSEKSKSEDFEKKVGELKRKNETRWSIIDGKCARLEEIPTAQMEKLEISESGASMSSDLAQNDQVPQDLELQKEHEQKCAQYDKPMGMEKRKMEIMRKLEKRKEIPFEKKVRELEAEIEELKKTRDESEDLRRLRQLEEENMRLKSVLTKSEAIRSLKAELEVANQKVELLQHVVLDIEAMMVDLKRENEILKVDVKSLEGCIKKSKFGIERLVRDCAGYMEQNGRLEYGIRKLEDGEDRGLTIQKELKEKIRTLEGEVGDYQWIQKEDVKVIKNISFERDRLGNKLADLEDQKKKLNVDMENQLRITATLNDEVVDLKSRLSAAECVVYRKNEEIESLKDACKKCKNSEIPPSKQQLEHTLDKISKEINGLLNLNICKK